MTATTVYTPDRTDPHLGVSIRHVRRLVFERRIPYVKWGHLLRFDIDDVNYWVARSTVEAINDSALSFRH